MLLRDLLYTGVEVVIDFISGDMARDASRDKVGKDGEDSVNCELYKLGDEYTCYSDLYIPNSSGGYTQIDHLVVSKYCLLCIETKNFYGLIYGNDISKEFTRYNNCTSDKFYSPIHQNIGHIKNLSKHIGIDSSRIVSVVVFGNNANIDNVESTSYVINTCDVYNLAKHYKDIIFTDDEISSINNSLRYAQAGSFKKLVHKYSVKGLKRKNKKMEKRKCPVCGSSLAVKSSKHGQFIGCSSYPKCNYTSKL